MEKSEIKAYIFCVECVKEMPEGVPISEYGQLTMGATDHGLLVWCDRHDCEVYRSGEEEPTGDNAMALFLLMDFVATAAKMGDSFAVPFLEAQAVRIMPDGVAIYQRDRFAKVMSEMISKM